MKLDSEFKNASLQNDAKPESEFKSGILPKAAPKPGSEFSKPIAPKPEVKPAVEFKPSLPVSTPKPGSEFSKPALPKADARPAVEFKSSAAPNPAPKPGTEFKKSSPPKETVKSDTGFKTSSFKKSSTFAVSDPTKTASTTQKPQAGNRSRGKKVTIEARIDVGFGNTLYLRGEGRGLSWNQGIPLTCVNASTWTWSSEVDDQVKFKLLLNDTVWSKGDDLVVTPGDKVQVAPAF